MYIYIYIYIFFLFRAEGPEGWPRRRARSPSCRPCPANCLSKVLLLRIYYYTIILNCYLLLYTYIHNCLFTICVYIYIYILVYLLSLSLYIYIYVYIRRNEELVRLIVGLVINRDNTTPVIYFTKSAFFSSCNIQYGKLI